MDAAGKCWVVSGFAQVAVLRLMLEQTVVPLLPAEEGTHRCAIAPPQAPTGPPLHSRTHRSRHLPPLATGPPIK